MATSLNSILWPPLKVARETLKMWGSDYSYYRLCSQRQWETVLPVWESWQRVEHIIQCAFNQNTFCPPSEWAQLWILTVKLILHRLVKQMINRACRAEVRGYSAGWGEENRSNRTVKKSVDCERERTYGKVCAQTLVTVWHVCANGKRVDVDLFSWLIPSLRPLQFFWSGAFRWWEVWRIAASHRAWWGGETEPLVKQGIPHCQTTKIAFR